MFQHSGMDYTLTVDLIELLCNEITSSGRSFFSKKPISNDQSENGYLNYFGCDRKNFNNLIGQKFQLNSGKSACEYLFKLNCYMGGDFKKSYGVRMAPVYVMSKDCPWASFIAATPNPFDLLQLGIDILIKRSIRECDYSILAIGLPLLIILAHPFRNGNGRVMRVVLYRVLKERLGLSEDAALDYARFLFNSKWSFVHAFYEVRYSSNFDAYLSLFD